MCNGFGMIVSSDLRGYFTTPDDEGDISHSDILRSLGWKDNTNQFVRRFIRVECPDWTMGSFHFDEESTLPGWAEENREAIMQLVDARLGMCAAAWAEYEKVCAPAWAEYEKVRAPAWAEYEKVRDAARSKMRQAFSDVEGFVN